MGLWPFKRRWGRGEKEAGLKVTLTHTPSDSESLEFTHTHSQTQACSQSHSLPLSLCSLRVSKPEAEGTLRFFCGHHLSDVDYDGFEAWTFGHFCFLTSLPGKPVY
ncbi:hypothetical protein SRHO_G00154010 [Serrasalmus rhombeus]